jgi:hypothetical protein
MNDTRSAFLRAQFPPIPDATTMAFLNITRTSFEQGHPRQAEQPTIAANIRWDYTFDLEKAAASVAQHKLGGDGKHIGTAAFVEDEESLEWYFLLNDVTRVLRRKPQMWGISKPGVLGAVLERDGVFYEFFVRGKRE